MTTWHCYLTLAGTRGGSRSPCPVGHYQDLIKSIECKKCPIGTLCNSTGIIYPMVKCSGYVCQQGEVALCQQYCPHGKVKQLFQEITEITARLTACLFVCFFGKEIVL